MASSCWSSRGETHCDFVNPCPKQQQQAHAQAKAQTAVSKHNKKTKQNTVQNTRKHVEVAVGSIL